MVPLVERGLEPNGGGGSTCLEANEHSVPLEAACLLGGDPGGQEEIMGALRLDKVPHSGVSLDPGVRVCSTYSHTLLTLQSG